jgi:hypothetical protein
MTLATIASRASWSWCAAADHESESTLAIAFPPSTHSGEFSQPEHLKKDRFGD